MKDKKDIAFKELDKLYKKAGILHDEVNNMRERYLQDVNNSPLIRHKIIWLEILLGVNKSQYDCLVEIIDKNIERLHDEIEINLNCKRKIIEDWANLLK